MTWSAVTFSAATFSAVTHSAVTHSFGVLPDLPPWLDNESDDEEEVACDDVDMAYDE